MIRCARGSIPALLRTVLPMLLLAACASPVPLDPLSGRGRWVTISSDNSGRGVVLKVDQELVVRLASRPTTGYRWLLIEAAPALLAPLGQPTFERDRLQDAVDTVLGSEVWRFKALAAGSATLRFESHRPHERQEGAAPELVFPITIQP